MDNDRKELIRERAHKIWERDGQPEGRETEHWEQARAEIEAEAEKAGDASTAGDPIEEPKSVRKPKATKASA